MRRLGILIILAILVAACGQKGPLYLPKDSDKPQMTEEGTIKEGTKKK